jgi:hypothetical protein
MEERVAPSSLIRKSEASPDPLGGRAKRSAAVD